MDLKLDVNLLVNQIIDITEKATKAVQDLEIIKAENLELKSELSLLETEKLQKQYELENDLHNMYKESLSKNITSIEKAIKTASGE